MAITPITLTGSFHEPNTTTVATGTVTFRLSHAIHDPSTNAIIAAIPRTATLSSGAISTVLAANDDTTTVPSGTRYYVEEHINGQSRTPYYITIPYNAPGATIDLADLTHEEDEVDPAFTYALLTTVLALLGLDFTLLSGPLAVITDVQPEGRYIPANTTLTTVKLRVGTAPVGASITVLVKRSGSTLATASITTGSLTGSLTGLNVALTAGDILHFDITSVGSTTAGSDLAITLVGS